MNAQMINPLSGQGGIQDRAVNEQPATWGMMNPFVYGMDMVRAAQWAWVMHAGDWAAQKVADIPVFDMYREGWTLKYTGEKPDGSQIEKAIKDTEDRIELVPRFSQASRMERIFGGAAVIIGVAEKEGARTEDPLTPDMVDKGDLRFLNVIGRNYITKVEWDFNANSPGYGRPRHYNIRGQIFHASRVIIFDNNPISPYPGYDFMTAVGNWDGMGVSVYGPLWDSLMRVNSYQQGLAHIAQSANVWIAARKGLKDLQAARGGSQGLSELQRMIESLSMYRGYIIDGEDVKIEQLTANVAGFQDVIEGGYRIVGAGADIPAVRFFGQEISGLSSNDETSLENYYNNIAARQRLFCDPKLKKLEPYILNSTFGRNVVTAAEITREFVPLWNLSETEKADIRTKDVQNVTALEAANLLTRENAIEELLKREAITVKPDIDELERQSDEMMGMADAAGIDPEAAVAEVGGQQPKPFAAFNASDWDESNHPRADDGKFGKGGGGKSDSGGSEGEHPFEEIPLEHRQELRKKFDDSPEIGLTGNEIDLFSKSMSLVDIRKEMPKWAEEHGITGPYKNIDKGWDNIAVTPGNIEDSLWHGTTVDKVKTVPAIPKLIENGIYITTTKARNEKQQGMKSHVFAGKVNLQGKTKAVGFIIKEDAQGKKFFDHELTEIADLDESLELSGSTPSGEKVAGPRQGHIKSILRQHLYVKNSIDSFSTMDVVRSFLWCG